MIPEIFSLRLIDSVKMFASFVDTNRLFFDYSFSPIVSQIQCTLEHARMAKSFQLPFALVILHQASVNCKINGEMKNL